MNTYTRIAETRSTPIGGWRDTAQGKPSARKRIKLWEMQREMALRRIKSMDKYLASALAGNGVTANYSDKLAKRNNLAEMVRNLNRLLGREFDRVPNAPTKATKPVPPVKLAVPPPVPTIPPTPKSVPPVDLGVPLPAERVKPVDVTYPSREGQQQFRSMILQAYGRCAVTGCQDEAVLQAAHVIPYVDARSNVLQNGICLRADIHCLYDRNLIRIRADGLVWVDPAVRSYRDLDGTRIDGRLPDAALLEVRHLYVEAIP
jgi:hypothetical protein